MKTFHPTDGINALATIRPDPFAPAMRRWYRYTPSRARALATTSSSFARLCSAENPVRPLV